MVNKKVNTESEATANGSSEFPKHPLKTALRVPLALEEKNSGNPMPPTDVAIAIDKSPGSSDFRMLLSSSIKYGLSTGSYNQSKVALTALARDIVAPTSDEAKNKALFQSAFMPPLFKSIFGAYKGKKVPDMQFFQNALVRDFGVSRDQVARCAAVFYENADYLGLVRQATTGKWLASEPTGIAPQEEPAEAGETGGGENDPIEEKLPPSQPEWRRRHPRCRPRRTRYSSATGRTDSAATARKIPVGIQDPSQSGGRRSEQGTADLAKGSGFDE